MASSSNVRGFFKFAGGDRLEIDSGLLTSSEVVKSASSNANAEFEVPVDNEIDFVELELMNEFTKFLREQFADKFEKNALAKDFWFDFMVSFNLKMGL